MHSARLRYLLASTALTLTSTAAIGGPPAVREKEQPATWKHAELNGALPNTTDRGAVVVLAWEVVEFDGVFATEERCLVVKRYAAPTATGRVCAVGVLSRLPTGRPPEWAPSTVKEYAALPTDEELEGVLKKHGWHADLKPSDLVLRIGAVPPNVVRYVPQVADGGVCPAGWKKGLGRAVPAHMFPELVPAAPNQPPQLRPKR